MGSLPYENATSGRAALAEAEKLLGKFGCQSFGHMLDFQSGELLIQFRYRDMPISIRASAKGYAAAWLKQHPYTYGRSRRSKADHEKHALEIGNVAIYSMVRDWIKGQITAIECGILSFESAFLGQILLPSGQTVMEHVTEAKILQLEGPKRWP